MSTKRFAKMAFSASIYAGVISLMGCNQQPAPANSPAPATTSPAPATTTAQAPAYVPPTAEQLYQMVAPIALFPDKLVAQVLAGSTYPDQITAADNLLARNPNLKGGLLSDAVNPQPWDPSVKGLTTFPSVLDQMAQNLPWTRALGEAYVNDPTDVLNAIQVMRQRAAKHGNLRSTPQQQVVTQPAEVAVDQGGYADDGNYPPTYSGPSMVPAQQQMIEIEPAQDNTVYVPSYDPQMVYGGDVPAYPSYVYEQPSYSTGEIVAAGAVSFGVGVIVASMLDHHSNHGGWNSWGMNWGGRGGNDGGGNRGGWQRPAVVYNNQTYVSRSTTIINRNVTNNITNNVNNSRNEAVQNRNVANNAANPEFNYRNGNNARPSPPTVAVQQPSQPAHMTTPNFGAPGHPTVATNESRPATTQHAMTGPRQGAIQTPQPHAAVEAVQRPREAPSASVPNRVPVPHEAAMQARPPVAVPVHAAPVTHAPQAAPRPQPAARPATTPRPVQQNRPQPKAAPPHPKKDDESHG